MFQFLFKNSAFHFLTHAFQEMKLQCTKMHNFSCLILMKSYAHRHTLHIYVCVCAYIYSYTYILLHIHIYACVINRLSPIQLFATLWSVACKALLSMIFSKQESWSELPYPFLGIFLTQGLNPCLLHLQHCQAGSLTTSATWEAHIYAYYLLIF